MATKHETLLGLCGYTSEDISSERSRLETVFERIGIDNTDLERAEHILGQLEKQ